MVKIVRFQDAMWREVWSFLEPVFRAGETYAFDPEISQDEARDVWIGLPMQTYVAVNDDNAILGTYYIKPNQPKLGAHVCNCGYVVAEEGRGKGVASAMCTHSQDTARTAGFKAMQYNLVAASNTNAVRLWQKHGFGIIGTLPRAFNHPRLGLVDAHVMYKWL